MRWFYASRRAMRPTLCFPWNSEAEQDTLVTITLEETDEGTEITLVHEFLPNEEMVKNHTEGWTLSLNDWMILLPIERG